MFIARSEYGKLQPSQSLPTAANHTNPTQIVVSSEITPIASSDKLPLTHCQHLLSRRSSVPGRILARGHQARFDRDRRTSPFTPRNTHPQESEQKPNHSSGTQVATGEGVILGVEKRVTSTLLETSSVEKIVEIDRHIGCAMSGLQADARSMIEHARVESQNHAFHYNEPLRVESCTQAICDLALRFGEGAEGEESIMSRPFGVALLIAGYDEDGPSL